MTDALPPNFDWVTIRANCTALDMFARLRDLARRDTGLRNGYVGENQSEDRFRYHDSESNEWAFSVWDRLGRTRRGTDFRLDAEVIHIEPTEGEAFTATVTFTDAGECRLKVGNEVLDLWQVLRRALEPLFF